MGAKRVRTVLAVLVACWMGACTTTSSTTHRKDDIAQDQKSRAQAHLELGMSYYDSRNFEFAIEELNEALKSKSDFVPAYDGLALIYMELKEDKKAEDAFKKALRYKPDSSGTKNNYGQFLCSRGRAQEGLRQLLGAVKNPLYDTPDVAYTNAGQCARREGDNQAAEEYFRQAVMRNPRQGQALYNLSDLNFIKKNYSQAKVYGDRLLQMMDKPGPEVLWLATRIERKLSNMDSVSKFSEQLRRRYPDSPETRALLDGRFE